MNLLMICAFTLAFVALAYGHKEEDGPAHYNFEYGVHDPKTGDHKSQHETRDGHVVKGSYTVDEPDGTKRIVEYIADHKNGFQAFVKRVGEARHPAHYGKADEQDANGGESHVGPTHWGHH